MITRLDWNCVSENAIFVKSIIMRIISIHWVHSFEEPIPKLESATPLHPKPADEL
jgi:hypothetical protein